MGIDMTKAIAATLFLIASFSTPVFADDIGHVGHDCAEGDDEYVVALPQTPMPLPTPAPGS